MKNQIVFLGVLVLHGAFARASAPAQFSVATAPDGVPLSQQFQVRLRSTGTDLWRSAPVYAFFKQHVYNWAPTAESPFVTFDSTGDLDVEVTVSGPATAPVIRPSSRKLAVQQTGATLRFTMNDSSRQLSLEINRDAPDPYWPEAVLSIHPTQMSEYGSTEYMGTMPPVRRVASSAGVYLIPRCFWFFLVVHISEAANWNHEWIPVGNETGIQWSVCPLKYEKKWAYAIELDDGTADTGQFAPRFFAQFQFADAPPGVGQGRRMPVVGSLALFPYCLEANPAILNFDQVREICSQGWAVANHSYAHKGRTWGDPPEVLTREQIREDLF